MSLFNRAEIIDKNFISFVKSGNLPQARIDLPLSNTNIKPSDLVSLFESQVLSRHMDLKARLMKDDGKCYYTIGSSGHEGNAVFGKIFSIEGFNRSFNKIKNDKRILPFRLTELSKHLYTADIIINTIPATKTKQQHIFDMLDAVHKFGKLESIGYDIVYNQETNFLNNFKPSYRIHGTLMLIHQAAPCFKKWFKIAPKIDNKIVKKLLQQTKKKQ